MWIVWRRTRRRWSRNAIWSISSSPSPDEIANASPPSPLRTPQPLVAARCVNGNLVRPDSAEEESPSTACRQSIVTAPGGVPLGRAPPRQQQLPGVYEAEVFLRHLHRHLQHQCPLLRQHPMRQHIHCSGHHCTPGQRHQEEVSTRWSRRQQQSKCEWATSQGGSAPSGGGAAGNPGQEEEHPSTTWAARR